jgi:hypothetical protein
MNEVVQEAEGVETVAQPAPEPASDQQQFAEPQAGQTEAEGAEREHPLAPGGDRFKEVWARAKRAEEEREALKERLHQAELERARLEGERKAAEEARQHQKQAEPEYSWPQLRQMIANGQITEDAAYDYKEKMQKKREEARDRELDAKLAQLMVKDKVAAINGTIERYKTALPSLMQPGSPERQKYEAEYRYLVQELGDAPTLATELKAVRAAFGPIESVESAAKTRTVTTQQRTSFMDTTTQRQVKPKTKDPIESLSDQDRDLAIRMIRHGRYGPYSPRVGITPEHWAKVREDLTWTRKR